MNLLEMMIIAVWYTRSDMDHIKAERIWEDSQVSDMELQFLRFVGWAQARSYSTTISSEQYCCDVISQNVGFVGRCIQSFLIKNSEV